MASWTIRLGIVAVLACAATACSGGVANDTPSLRLPPRSGTAASPDDPDSGAVTPTEGEDLPGTDAGREASAPAVPCDPAANPALLGVKLLDDPLTTDTGKLAPAPGFPVASWSYANAAYRQTRLVDAADATLVTGKTDLGDVFVKVDGASTAVSSALTPRLRQMFVVLGAKTVDGAFSAYGCGAEVVEGQTPEQRTSVVELTGSPGAITTTPLDRAERAALQVNEAFTIRALVRGTTITCSITQGANVVTTATATTPANVRGAIGFFTRQTEAAFTNVSACEPR